VLDTWPLTSGGDAAANYGHANRTEIPGIQDCPHSNLQGSIPGMMNSSNCDLSCNNGMKPIICSAGALLNDPEQCNDVMAQLSSGDQVEQHRVLLWLQKVVRHLALSKMGCRIVQKAFEVASGADHDMLVAELKDHVVELYESPHGNYVLSRAIEILPAAKNNFVISALSGRWAGVSRHRFGCRVICRLLEHCSDEQMGELLSVVVAEADTLARHAYGNFVVQSALEHALPGRRAAILLQILPDFGTLTMHRTGSLVAQRALNYCDVEGQGLAIQALLRSSVVDVACSHYGSYVIEQVAGMRGNFSSMQDMYGILAANLQQVHASEHGERVVLAFGLAPVESLAPTVENGV